jgi:hypothetical protein
VRKLALLLPFVVVSLAANSLITRFVVARGLLDAGLLGATRFAAGAVVLAAVAPARGERSLVRRAPGARALAGRLRRVHLLRLPVHRGGAGHRRVLLRGAGHAHRLRPVHRSGRGAGGGWSARRWRSPGWPCWRWRGGGVTVLGVVLPAATGITWGLWYACQRSISATTAGTVQLVIPVLTAAGAVALLGEPLSVALFVATGLVAAGMWLARPASPAAPQRG